jgi:hypothetical protein
MDRTLYLTIGEGEAIAGCLKAKVGVSTIERLPSGGVRLVCMSGDGAETMRSALKSKLIEGPVAREPLRPRGLSW